MIFKDIHKSLNEESLILDVIRKDNNFTFNKLETDSRLIQKDDVFVCITGFQADGHDFAISAKENGASLIICEKPLELEVNQVVVSDSRKAAALLAKLHFEDPGSKLSIIGITGTNGKTTIANMLGELFSSLGYKCGIIGTLGYKVGTESYPTNNTTPDIIKLNEILAQMATQECEYVFMEVSSHAIALQRIHGIKFTAALFTNLSQDHLDFHPTIEDYANTKFKLMDLVLSQGGFSIINIDDDFGWKYYKQANRIRDKKPGLYSLSKHKGDFNISEEEYSLSGSRFYLNKNKIKTKLIGEFNIFNVAAVLAVAHKLIPDKHNLYVKAVAEIGSVPGRMQRIPNNKNIGIFVDYAHTPDALQNVLSTLKTVEKSRLICLFGAGGNRDKSKRPLMLQAAMEHADITIVTSDNPRDEVPAAIIRDITKNAPANEFWIIESRSEAIASAIALARENDIIVIAGKGHETYQEIKGEKHYFSDADEVETALKFIPKKLDPTSGELAYKVELLQLEAIFQQRIDTDIKSIYSVSTDSRTIKPNAIFFALKGEKFDGHDYVSTVLAKENCLVVVNKDFSGDFKNLIRVDDTLLAYGNLARSYKQLFPAETIAITGSVGKTTTKEYLYHILKNCGNVLKTHANENNQIGLPKTIFRLCPSHKFAIYELGSNHFGEIEALAKIAEPDLSVITSIGSSHLEFLINRDGVIREKSALLDYAKKAVLFPDDVPELDQSRWENFEEDEIRAYTFGFDDDSDFHLSEIVKVDHGCQFQLSYDNYFIPSQVPSNLRNSTIAISIARLLHIDEKIIKKAISQPLHVPMRMEIVKNNERILLIDCYNANPDSMQAALRFWESYLPDNPHVAILGDMLELGELTEKFHLEIYDLIKKMPKAMYISVGRLAKLFKADHHFTKVEDLLSGIILDEIPKNACVLLKASHGIQLEKLLKRL